MFPFQVPEANTMQHPNSEGDYSSHSLGVSLACNEFSNWDV